MWKRFSEGLIVALVSAAWIHVHASTNTNEDRTKIDFRGGSSLVFSRPLKNIEAKTLEPGWKRAVFVTPSGSQILLFSMEFLTSMNGLVFGGKYPPRISPSGKYAVLDVLRAGTVDPGSSGAPEESSRKYCQVLHTESRCVVSMQTGEICGGDWTERADAWVVTGYGYDATKAMVGCEFSGANELWSQFLKSTKLNNFPKIEQYLSDNLGIANLMTCEPLSESSRDSYAAIARQLIQEGDRTDAEYIEKKLGIAVNAGVPSQGLMITVDRAPLYDLPDLKAKTKMYLVKGDAVKALDKADADWVRIEYVRKNCVAIDKWIQSASIK